jgi:hypothetical protein
MLFVDSDGVVVAYVKTPPGTTSALVPAPPSGVAPVDLLGTGVWGYVRTCDENETDTWCLRGATGSPFMLEP